MPEQDTDVLEVLISQVGECRNADPIFSKAFCILPETERFEPVRNILHRGLASGEVIFGLTEATDRFSDKFPARYTAGLDRPSKCPRRCCGAPKPRRQRSSWVNHVAFAMSASCPLSLR